MAFLSHYTQPKESYMIIFGTSDADNLDHQVFPEHNCPTCNEPELVSVIYSRYVHVYWVPFFSFGKKAILTCEHCGAEFRPKDAPLDIQNKILEKKREFKIPIWHFTGLGVLLLIFANIAFQSHQDGKNYNKWIEAPEVGDRYEWKESSNSYTLLKVAAIDSDSILVIQNLYETDRPSGLNSIDEVEKFDSMGSFLAKETLIDFFEEGKIIGVKREE